MSNKQATDESTWTIKMLLEAIQGEASAYEEEHDGCRRINRLVSLAQTKLEEALAR